MPAPVVYRFQTVYVKIHDAHSVDTPHLEFINVAYKFVPVAQPRQDVLEAQFLKPKIRMYLVDTRRQKEPNVSSTGSIRLLGSACGLSTPIYPISFPFRFSGAATRL